MSKKLGRGWNLRESGNSEPPNPGPPRMTTLWQAIFRAAGSFQHMRRIRLVFQWISEHRFSSEKLKPLGRPLDYLPSYFHIFFLGHAQLFTVVQTNFYEATKAIPNSNSMEMELLSPSTVCACESIYENKISLKPCLPMYMKFQGKIWI